MAPELFDVPVEHGQDITLRILNTSGFDRIEVSGALLGLGPPRA
jgi:hypothetical protein